MANVDKLCFGCFSALQQEGGTCPHCGRANETLVNERNQLPCGTILAGKYLAGRALGQGGFGVTYIGFDLMLERRVAIKEYYPEGFCARDVRTRVAVVPLSGARREQFEHGKDRFLREARMLAQVENTPGVVSVQDFFMENGTAYIVMEYIDGKTLKTLTAEAGGRLPAPKVLFFMRPLIASLAAVHAVGLLHRDIAPDNIMIRNDGSAVLIDFGAATELFGDAERSKTIHVKHGYAPEEQYRSHGRQGPWTDVYAMCATIYRVVTGVTLPSSLDRFANGEALPSPRSCGAALSEAQQAALIKGLSVRAENRQQSMPELERDLFQSNTRTPIPNESSKTGRTVAIVLASAACLIAAVLLISKRMSGGEGKTDVSLPAEIVAGGDAATRPAAQRTAQITDAPLQSATNPPVKTLPAMPTDGSNNSTQGRYVCDPDDFSVETGSGGLAIKAYRGNDEYVEIPSTIDGQPVVTINAHAFEGNHVLRSVIVPQGVTQFGVYAFASCTALESVSLPSTLTGVANNTFNGCTSLTSVELPSSLKRIQSNMFRNCISLVHVSVPSGVSVIGNGAFAGCGSLEDVELGVDVVRVEPDAFLNCASLTRLTNYNRVTNIQDGAFNGCARLTLYGYRASSTRAFALETGMPFVELGD